VVPDGIAASKTSPQFRAASGAEMLAADPHGATKDLLVLAYGFDGDMIADLVRRGFATAQRESMKAGGKTIDVVRIRITSVGRQAIES